MSEIFMRTSMRLIVEVARLFGRYIFTRDVDKRWQLIAERPFLQKMMDAWHPDLNVLLKRKLISLDEFESLLFSSREDRCLTLLAKVLPEKGTASYDKFLYVLEDTGEMQAAKIMRSSETANSRCLTPDEVFLHTLLSFYSAFTYRFFRTNYWANRFKNLTLIVYRKTFHTFQGRVSLQLLRRSPIVSTTLKSRFLTKRQSLRGKIGSVSSFLTIVTM